MQRLTINTYIPYLCVMLLFILVSSWVSARAAEPADAGVWDSLLKNTYFENRTLHEGKSVIEINVPRRAEDAGIVPVSIHAKIPQTPDHYIKTLYVFVDKNPQPLAGTFHMTPESGRADLALRLRVNEYTHVRAVAELNDGELYMDSSYTRASGGCTKPPPFLTLKTARKNIGKMKFRSLNHGKPAPDAQLGQLIVSHPNVTGLQLDQRTRAYIPAEYMTHIAVSYNDKPVFTADTGISISTDPSFRFFFKKDKAGRISALMEDNKGRKVAHSFSVE